MSNASADHWNGRYDAIGAESVSWYQDTPTTSLELLTTLGINATKSVIDVGGGASNLVDHLVAAGHTDVGVLDLSAVALEVAQQRLADNPAVEWLEQDLLTWQPSRTWDAWHDRAVLHFLLTDYERARYAETVRKVVAIGGAVVIGTFAEDGPTECSALPVRRNSAGELRSLLGDIEVVEERREVHHTPSGATQPFNWLAARLR